MPSEPLGSLKLATTGFRSHGPSSPTAIIGTAAATVLVVTAPALVGVSERFVVPTTTTHTTSLSRIASIRIGAGTTLLDKNLLPANCVWVGGNGSIVGGGVCILDKSAILE